MATASNGNFGDSVPGLCLNACLLSVFVALTHILINGSRIPSTAVVELRTNLLISLSECVPFCASVGLRALCCAIGLLGVLGDWHLHSKWKYVFARDVANAVSADGEIDVRGKWKILQKICDLHYVANLDNRLIFLKYK